MVKLSFIVPVYNVAQYLRKCVESLIKQDFSDYEIILVDDGSTDESPQICDEFASSKELSSERISELGKPIIRVIHQPNAGLSAARNAGLKMAKGEYVCFVDSDDYWEENVLGTLMFQIESQQLDVLRFNYQNVRLKNEGVRELESEGNYEVFRPNKDPKRNVDYSDVVTDGETFLNERLGPSCYAVMFVIKRSLIMNELESERVSELGNSIEDRRLKIEDCLFKEGIYFEDVEWTPRMLMRAKRVASTPMVVYNYLWRAGSITLPSDPVKRKKVIEDKILILRGFKEQSMTMTDSKWFTWMTCTTTMSVLSALTTLSAGERTNYIQELKSLHVFPLSTIRARRKNKIKIWLANINPSLYCKLMRLRH